MLAKRESDEETTNSHRHDRRAGAGRAAPGGLWQCRGASGRTRSVGQSVWRHPEPGQSSARSPAVRHPAGVQQRGMKALAAQQQPCKTSFDARSFRLPDHQTLARQTSRPPPALFAADAERRQGLDHAGRDRPALRGASGRLQQGRPEDAGIPVAQSERQDPRDHRSGRARRQAAAAVRVRRDPAISRGEDRQASAGRSGAALPDHPVAALPDGRDRADVRPGRLLPQIRRQGVSPTSGRSSAMSPSRSACWA